MDLNRELKTIALIVAGGRGQRIAGTIPKQYVVLGSETVLSQTVRLFVDHSKVDAVRVVIHPDDEELYQSAMTDLDLLPPVHGGTERQDSVRLGLESLVEVCPSIVLIHDSVRPFVSNSIIDEIIEEALKGRSCIPGLPVSDTVKKVENGYVLETLERSKMWHIQTPQGYPYTEILSAHRSLIGQNCSDDAAVAEAYGLSVSVVHGSADNVKITHPEDMERAKNNFELQIPDIRVGSGYDVHRFSKGEFLTICGVKIPYIFSLEGHSDADVGMHAATDAILGAAGKGDIGEYFSPSDEKWRDAPSHTFLSYAGELVRSMNGIIQNLDITIICEAPKIAPYRYEMRNKISETLSLSPSRINIKGKTTEKLGFTGRKEGIAAQATATLLIRK